MVVLLFMHLMYELIVDDNALKTFRPPAHWELPAMLRQQVARRGVASGFLHALRSVARQAKRRRINSYYR